ncbi:TolC family outer membrane protein [Samsonia erythrinae]|uniref:Protease secretion system outer membrane protein n=1 Tax=Samsonia erythrinae TaxID=160434 RepID=A0A4R3VTR8_9GAMM|nr:TolC family outer membrane protein [Samsonia erythrinae]TCV09301.1 protease secretion system outer membrane protein [Samsonia erythrinae]
MQRIAIIVLAGLFSSGVSALGLLDAWELALRNDAQFRAAGYAREAGQEEPAIGRAGLLPALQYSYGANRSHSKVTQTDSLADSTLKRDYNSYTSTLSLRQPLLDYAAWARYQQGMARKLMADQRFRERSQDLMVRLYKAWSDALLAQEKLQLLDAQQRAYQAQLALNKRLLSAGEGTLTDMRETEARFMLTEAQRIEQQDNLDAALTELENMIGTTLDIRALHSLTFTQLPSSASDRRTLAQWRDLAIQHNANLGAQREELAVSRYEIERSRAGHLPTLSLVASSRNSRSESEYNYNQKYNTQSVGLQLNVPLYSGGGVSASMRQAAAEYQQHQAELDDQTRQTLAELKKYYNLYNNGVAKIKAWQMTAASAQEAVNATRLSVAGGERINLDILLAEQDWYNARRELAEAKYSWLQAWLLLRYTAGTLNEKDILQLAAWFQPIPA